MPDDNLPRFLTPKRFAEELDMHRETVYRYLQSGRIPGARKVGRRWKIPRWAVDEVGVPAHQVA